MTHGVVAPSAEDGVVRAASEVAGGPAGAHVGAGRHGPWTATPMLLLAVTATMGLALLARQHCRTTLWASPDQFTHACYSDIPAVYLSAGLHTGVVPYLDQAGGAYLAAPVGTGILLWLLSLVVPPDLEAGQAALWQFDLAVLLVGVAAVLVVLAVVRLSGRRPWDGALVALSPVLVTSALVSLDLAAVALALLGLWSFARRRPALAGALLGLAATVRPVLALVLLALLLVGVRSGRRRPVRVTLLAAAAVVAAVNVPVLIASPEGWWAYPRSLLEAPVGYGSLWLLPQLAGYPVPASVARWTAAVLALLVVVAVTLFALGARRRPRLPVLVLLLVVGVLVVGVAIPVQASLLVLAFAALALPSWRDLLLWGAVEAAYATGTWFYLYAQSEPSRGLPPWAYAMLLVARVAALGWLAWRAVEVSRDPRLDAVRATGRDDPAAGDLEDAPDAVVVRFT